MSILDSLGVATWSGRWGARPPLWAALPLAIGACAVAPSVDDGASPEPNPAVSSELDVGMTLGHVRRAFRPASGGSYEAYSETLVTAVNPAGAVAIQPRHEDDAGVHLGGALTIATEYTTAVERIENSGSGLAIHREGVVEHLQSRQEGLHQWWDFAEHPSGGGDLVVRVAVGGYDYLRTTASGIHFLDSASPLGLRYGHASFIDANGTTTAVPSIFVGGRIEMRVPATALHSGSFPAVLDPVISAELAVDTPVAAVSGFTETDPAVAFDGTNYLVVWSDFRDTRRVWGARVSGAGALLDSFGFPIADHGEEPAVAFNGADYYVVWWDRSIPDEIRGTRVTPAGVVAPSSPLASGGLNTPQVASDGTDFLMVYDSGGGAYGVRIAGDGTPLDGTPFRISIPLGGAQVPTVAGIPGQYLVAWHRVGVQATRIQSDGTVLDPTPLVLGTTSPGLSFQDVGSDGTRYLVAWADSRDLVGGGLDIYARTVSSAGVLGPDLRVTTNRFDQTHPTIGFDGSNFLVAWSDERDALTNGLDLYGARVAPSGGVLDVPPLALDVTGPDQEMPDVAGGLGGGLVVYEDTQDAMARLVSAALSPGPSFPVAMGAGRHTSSAVAYGSGRYLISWADLRETRTAGTDVLASRIDSSGMRLDATPIAVATGARIQVPGGTWFDGANFLVTWMERDGYHVTLSDVMAARVSPGGVVLDSPPLILAAASTRSAPVVSFDGTDHLVSWTEVVGTTRNPVAKRVSVSGVVRDATAIALTGAGITGQVLGSSAIAGQHFVIHNRSNRIYGTRVEGPTVLDPAGIELHPTVHRKAHVASDGIGYAIASPTSSSLDVAYYQPGVAPARFTLPFSGVNADVVLTWDGASFMSTHLDATGLVGIRFRSDGSLLEPAAFRIATGIASGYDRAGASDGAGGTLVTYGVYDAAPMVRTERLRARLIGADLLDLGATCTGASVCSSGHCVDGVCCDSACGGSDPADCQACVTSAGASADGTCTALPATTECRSAAGPCDVAERCDGTATACPADAISAAGTECRAAVGSCDVAEACDGASSTCPGDALAPVGTVCRAALDECDAAETCDGSAACPLDADEPDGTVCEDDGLICNGQSSCASGSCVAAPPADCNDSDACTADTCEETSGCVHTLIVGCGEDAGTPDAGVFDSGLPDSGRPDSGVPDSGAADSGAGDAGVADAGVAPPEGGCGCVAAGTRGTPSRVPFALSLVAFIAVVARRRRRDI